MESSTIHHTDKPRPDKANENPAIKRIAAVFGDIKFAHTVFALPFALLSAHLAFLSIGGYRIDKLIAILICMVTARTAAMSFNRYIDRDLDSINPRTVDRSIPSGRATPSDTISVVIVCCLIFIAACWYLGILPLILSLPTIAFILSYSASKRFTWLTHLWLGTALAIAPMGAWIAVTGGWSWEIAVLCFAVVCWVSGFDIIYSLQDIDFDKNHRVFSIPATMGTGNALIFSRTVHSAGFLSFAVFGWLVGFNYPYWVALALVGIVLIAEHSMVRKDDFSRVGVAFFTMNGIISVVLYLSVLVSSASGLGIQ
ncbi:MAG TPA: 4-hydroxybenzoate octaprenyltransferase [Firmicutes bacterium]|nr:4-hydroxybenzoate octaprenyltransferase [Bacillota bacterium]